MKLIPIKRVHFLFRGLKTIETFENLLNLEILVQKFFHLNSQSSNYSKDVGKI